MDLCGLGRDVRNVTADLLREYIVWMREEKVQFACHKYKPEESKKVGDMSVYFL